MGCNSSAVLAYEPTRASENSKPGFGTEQYSWQKHPTLLQRRILHSKSDAKRRKPVLAVPVKVIAPFCGDLEDTGCQAYESMQVSDSFRLSVRAQVSAKLTNFSDVIDDIDGPPNFETTREYVKMLDFFMWDVSCHPEELKARVAELRGEMAEWTLPQEPIGTACTETSL